ncbi:MAG: hypothetical protein GX277_08770 [Bacteroidales bacterium]|nr:hypothetical protein [Bacteroidales bacterium]
MKNYLPFREKIAYGFGDLASVLYWQTFMLYFTFFYTDVFLMPAVAAATMFLISRLFDGFNDPIMGIIADRTNTRWGKFRPYLLWFCVPFAIVGVLTFTVPDFEHQGKMIWAYSTFILIMVLYTIINIPYTSLLGVISPNSAERTTVSSVKFIFAFAAGIIISATLLPMTQYLGKNDESIMVAKIQNDSIIISEQKRGVSTFLLTAKDDKENTTLHEIRFTVIPNDNNTPRVAKTPQTIITDKQFEDIHIPCTDIFFGTVHSNFTYQVTSSNPDFVSCKITQDTLLKISKKSNQELGFADITLSAIDKKWGETSTSFSFHVSENTNSFPKVIDSVKTKILSIGFAKHSIDVAQLFSDDDNDKLTYSVVSNNPDILDPILTNLSILELDELKSGVADITITANDLKGGKAEHTIRFFIADSQNNAPFVIEKEIGFEALEGFGSDTLLLSDFFYDIENDAISYELVVVNEAKGWSRFFMIIGVAAIIFFLIAFKGTKERVQPPKGQTSSIKKDLWQLITNKPWLIMLATTITFILFVAIRGSVTVHYFKYIIGHQVLDLPILGKKTYDFNVLTSIYNTIGQVASLLGVFAVGWFAKSFGKIKVFITFFIIAIISTASVFFLDADNLGLIYFLQITGSFTGGPLSVLLWAMYADIADYSEWKNGRRATGLIFSASTMSQKIGWAVGAFLALTLMAQVGFEPNQLQTAESTRGLLLLFTLIPAGIGIVSILIILLYPLNDTRVKAMELELMQRRDEENNIITT